MAARIDGVDISHHQAGSINYTLAKQAGVKFVFHKATEGATLKDSRYTQRRAEVAKAGIVFGAYHFARPNRDGKDALAEAKFFLDTARPKPGDMRPVLDLEDRNGLSRAALTEWVKVFVAEVKRQTGQTPIIYTPFDLNNTFNCPLWVARYSDAMNPPNVPEPWERYTIWQFSDGEFGKPDFVPGFGHVDLNTLRGVASETLPTLRLKTAQPAPLRSLEFIGRVVTANIKCNPTMVQSKVVADVKEVSTLAGVVFWQEIGITRYKEAIRALDRTVWQSVIASGGAGAIPISWKKKYWEFMSAGSVLTHKGRPLVSPNRYITWVILRNRKTGAVVVFVNTHFISGAWNRERKLFKKWRQVQWTIHWEKERDLIGRWIGRDMSVVGGGDFNRVDVRKFHRDMVWLDDGGIDKLFYVEAPKGANLREVATGEALVVDLNSDHHGNRAKIGVRK